MLTPLAQALGGAPFTTSATGPTAWREESCRTASPLGPRGSSAASSSRRGSGATRRNHLHDLIASDRRHPPSMPTASCTARPNTRTTSLILTPRRTPRPLPGPGARPRHAGGAGTRARGARRPLAPSPYWGEEKIWDTKANNHDGMFDRKGRVWFAAAGAEPRTRVLPEGLGRSSARLFPLERTNRSLTILDPKTMRYTFVDTCWGRTTCSSATTPTIPSGPAVGAR